MYTWDSKIETYRSYLSRKSYLSELTTGIDRAREEVLSGIDAQTRTLVGSQEEIQRVLSEDLGVMQKTVGAGFAEVSAAFNWGFSDMLAATGRMNDSIVELIRIAKTPTQTAALEHFEMARENHRRGLFEECLEELQKAIAGDHASSGYKTEWRFHQLRGFVLLGSFRSGASGLDDPGQAEEAFLAAARYARSDEPLEAAKALLSAGFAAYVQSRATPEKLLHALAHTEGAIALANSLGEALFQRSKLQMALGRTGEALGALRQAIGQDPGFLLRAAEDPDHRRYSDVLREFLQAMWEENMSQVAVEARSVLDFHRETLAASVAIRDYPAASMLTKLAQGAVEPSQMGLLDLLRYRRTGLPSDARALGDEVARFQVVQAGQARARSVYERHLSLLAASQEAREHPAATRLMEFRASTDQDRPDLVKQLRYVEQGLEADVLVLEEIEANHRRIVEAIKGAQLALAQQEGLLAVSPLLRAAEETTRLIHFSSADAGGALGDILKYEREGLKGDLAAFRNAVQCRLAEGKVELRRRLVAATSERSVEEQYDEEEQFTERVQTGRRFGVLPVYREEQRKRVVTKTRTVLRQVTVNQEVTGLVRIDVLGRVVSGPERLPTLVPIRPPGKPQPRLSRDPFLCRDPFLFGAAPVTRALWELFVPDRILAGSPGDEPAHGISWFGALTFCNELSRAAGMTPPYRQEDNKWHLVEDADGYRLPLPWEWGVAFDLMRPPKQQPVAEWCWTLGDEGQGFRVLGEIGDPGEVEFEMEGEEGPKAGTKLRFDRSVMGVRLARSMR